MVSHNPDLRIRQASLQDLRTLAVGGHLYAVIDACNVPITPRKVLELGVQRAVSLYRGTAEEDFWEIAPYLLLVDENTLKWVLEHAKAQGWGIVIASRAGLDVLRRHLRYFLKVQEPKGAIWLFRFYDPRVLKPFLVASSIEQLQTFFGPAIAFGVIDLESGTTTFYQKAKLPENAFPDSVSVTYNFPFKLSEAHVEALQAQSDSAFGEEVIRFLRAARPNLVQNYSDPVLKPMVLAGVARARMYGFTRNSSLAAFVAIMLDIAPNFDEQPGIRSVLLDSTNPPDLRLDQLMTRTTDKDWEAALSHSSPDAWKLN